MQNYPSALCFPTFSYIIFIGMGCEDICSLNEKDIYNVVGSYIWTITNGVTIGAGGRNIGALGGNGGNGREGMIIIYW